MTDVMLGQAPVAGTAGAPNRRDGMTTQTLPVSQAGPDHAPVGAGRR